MSSAQKKLRTAVICVGNDYQKDDGFGPAVAAYLRAHVELLLGADVFDCAVMGYAALPWVQEYDYVVVVDALDNTGAAPGTLFEFDPQDMAQSQGMASLHDVRFADVLASARFLGAACEGHCFGVQVEDLGNGTLQKGLSASVAAAVEPCARAVSEFIHRL